MLQSGVMNRASHLGKKIGCMCACAAMRGIALAGLLLAPAACGPTIAVPPTPTRDASAIMVAQNHLHGEGAAGGLRLFTKYGGPLTVAVGEQPAKPLPSQPFTITYSLKSSAGSPINQDGLKVTHQRLMHLILVSADLEYFSHIHPLPVGSGLYSVESLVPRPGTYLLFNEFVTALGVTQVERNLFSTTGAPPDTSAELTPDLGVPHSVDGLRVVLTSNTVKLRRRAPVVFTLEVSKDGEPVTEMEPFLGAPCHVAIISADTKQFTHTHGDVPGGAMSPVMAGMDMSKVGDMPVPAYFGPKLQFTHTFAQPGLYRVWVQFGYRGAVETAAYNMQVEK